MLYSLRGLGVGLQIALCCGLWLGWLLSGGLGCIEPNQLVCETADGPRLCGVGMVCTASGCAAADQLSACLNKPDGAACVYPQGVGACTAGACQLIYCGDGIRAFGEACDDGNTTGGDGCAANCASDESCGNGVLDPREQCDDGNGNDADGCHRNCKVPVCGDGIVDGQFAELCDDGNTIDGDGCAANCRSDERCGNGVRDAALGEACDDGNIRSGDGCDAACASTESCGNGQIDREVGEACDDGNTDAGDGCAANCRSNEQCGNGVIDTQRGEDCDEGTANSLAPNAACRPDCTLRRCGDGIVDAREQCDAGAGNRDDMPDACRVSCQLPRCGDGVQDHSEACDDGNAVGGDGCAASCLSTESCGNNYTDPNEQCDEGVPGLSGDGCASSCRRELPVWQDITPEPLRGRTGAAAAYDARRGRVVLFGGADANSKILGDTWEFVDLAWQRVYPLAAPTPRSDARMVYDAHRGVVVMFGGRNEIRAVDGLAETWEYDGVTWTLRSLGVSPEGRYAAAMGYDAERRITMLFGGSRENPSGMTLHWEYDGAAWRAVETSPLPGNDAPAMAYDQARRRMVLVEAGGHWEHDGSGWQRRAITLPASRGHVLVYDASAAAVIMVGGYAVGGGYYGQARRFNGASWTVTVTQPTGQAHTAVWHAGLQQIIHFGGSNGTLPLPDATWALKHTMPTSSGVLALAPTTPPARAASAIASARDRGVVLMFGGQGVPDGPNDLLGDTWRFHGRRWARVPVTVAPPARAYAAMAYDEGRHRWVLFGGDGERGELGDTWEFDGTQWTQVMLPVTPSPRREHAMAYDPRRQRIVLVGGRPDGSNTALNETWEYDGVWRQVLTADLQDGFREASLVYDAQGGRIIKTGGYALGGAAHDRATWAYNGVTWSAVDTAGPALAGHAVAYDAHRGVAVLVGGTTAAASNTQALEWYDAGWRALPTLTSLGEIVSPAAAYAPDLKGVIVFGGIFEGVPVAPKTWLLAHTAANVPVEECGEASLDLDHDGLAGCADPDCWWRCTPLCAPRETPSTGPLCAPASPRCGDGTCGEVETARACPVDCAP